jgi:hypothetical protein
VRDGQLDQASQAEDVDLELAAGLLDGHILHRPVGPVAGVVDQHVDTASLGDNLLQPGGHRGVLCDIHAERADPLAGERLHSLDPAGDGVHGETGRLQEQCRLRADPG